MNKNNTSSTNGSVFASFANHIETLQKRASTTLSQNQFDALLIDSGELQYAFLDDQTYPFRVNPHFNHWVPVTDVPNCWLLIDGVNKPKLYFYSPVDYWHHVEALPSDIWTHSFELIHLQDTHAIQNILAKELSKGMDKIAYIGSSTKKAEAFGIKSNNINPQNVINYLHYHRSFKTDYELDCMREAQKIAVEGHTAARQAFFHGLSEYEINAAFLLATGQRDTDVPYGNIVALNQNASVLHYTKLNKLNSDPQLNFLLDAGAQYLGYCADITRTTTFDEDDDFSELIKAMTREKLALISDIKTGQNYASYHHQMNQRIAKLLIEFGIITGLSESAIVDKGISRTFMPHGVGHPLGLQVHDVAGFMQNEQGETQKAPEIYPYLRCTRVIEPRMVLTIEPGMYFIDSLLEKWTSSTESKHFNWQLIEKFKPYGGIRVEDNIIVHVDHVENMTRDLELP